MHTPATPTVPTTSIASTLIMLSCCATLAHAELISFENTNHALGALKLFDPNAGDTIYGQSLDITHGVTEQPGVGMLPRASIVFMHLSGYAGEFVWMGTGMTTRSARSIVGTPFPDPWAGQDVDYYGPQGFNKNDTVSESANFVDGWRAIHVYNDLTGLPGIFTVGETFTVGIEFLLGNETHYGYASFMREYEIHDGVVDVQITPLRWGYETLAGVGANVVPAPGAMVAMMMGIAGSGLRRRRW